MYVRIVHQEGNRHHLQEMKSGLPIQTRSTDRCQREMSGVTDTKTGWVPIVLRTSTEKQRGAHCWGWGHHLWG